MNPAITMTISARVHIAHEFSLTTNIPALAEAVFEHVRARRGCVVAAAAAHSCTSDGANHGGRYHRRTVLPTYRMALLGVTRRCNRIVRSTSSTIVEVSQGARRQRAAGTRTEEGLPWSQAESDVRRYRDRRVRTLPGNGIIEEESASLLVAVPQNALGDIDDLF